MSALSYANRRGDRYDLHAGRTRTGKLRYFAAKTVGDGALDAMPEGYEFTESVKRQRVSDEQAWKDAKRLCGLSSRQVTMARALGMNPRKLPVGAFIEECYRKGFGGPPESDEFHPRRREPWSPEDTRETGPAAMGQAESLVCYLVNLAHDLESWLQHGTIAPEVLGRVREELREIADALDRGASIPQMPEIPLPPDRGRSAPRRRAGERAFDDDDDELPF